MIKKCHLQIVVLIIFSIMVGSTVVNAQERGTRPFISVDNGGELTKMATLLTQADRVWDVAFSPDGTLLATGQGNGVVQLWSMTTGEQLASMEGHEDAVISVAFTPDGSKIASGSRDSSVRVWDVAAHQQLAELNGHLNEVLDIVFSPDGNILASAGADNSIRLWDMLSFEQTAAIEGSNLFRSLAFAPDGLTLAASNPGDIRLWDVATQEELAVWPATGSLFVWVLNLDYSPDGTLLASASGDGKIALWDTTTNEPVQEFIGHTASVWSLDFSPDGTILVSTGFDDTIQMWNVSTGENIGVFENDSIVADSVRFNADGKLLATGGLDGSVHVWGISSGDILNFPIPVSPVPATGGWNHEGDPTIGFTVNNSDVTNFEISMVFGTVACRVTVDTPISVEQDGSFVYSAQNVDLEGKFSSDAAVVGMFNIHVCDSGEDAHMSPSLWSAELSD